MKRVERPKIEQLSTGEQFHLVDMNLFEVIEGKNEPSSIRFEVPDTENNKRVFEYVGDRNLLIFEGQYYILLVNKLNELGFKDCDAIQIGAELSRQTQEQKITGYLSIEEGLAHIFKGSNFKYINQCSPKNQLHFENFGGANRMSMIQNLIKRYDIECIFDNMTVIFADRIGKTTDKLYKFGYNVNAIEKTTDDSNCSFSVLLLGHTPSEEEGGGPQFTYYYESPLKYKMPELIRHRQAENIEDDKIKDEATALRRCKEVVNDIPIVSITVDHKEASFDDTNEPKVGDKAILQHHKYNMDFDVRVVKRRRYPFEQTPNVYEFSNKRDELVDRTEEQKKWTSDILSVVKELDKKLLEQSNDYSDRLNKITEEKVEEVRQESEAAKKLAELVKENQKNFQTTIVESDVPPTDYLEAGKSLWLDTSKGKPGILKKWNGKTWDPIIADVEAIKNETLQQVNKDIESTKTALNQKVEAVQKEATGQYNEVTQNLQGVTRTIANVQNEQGELDKKVTKFEQDSNGFKTSIESLTKKDTDISNKLNMVESTVEGTKKTISDVQSDTSALKKTTTEIKEQAGKITEQLTSVEKKFDNIDIGGPNLITGTENKSATGWKSWGSVGRVGVYAPMDLAGQSLYVETKSADGKTQLPVAKDTKIGLEATGHSFSVRAGREYTLSMEVATSEFGDVLDYIYLMYTVTGGNRKLGNIKVTDFPKVAPIYAGATTYYHKVKLTFKADRDDDNVHMLIGGAVKRALTGSNGYAWIRIVALKIEKGNVATAWTVAPEEQVSVDEFTKKATEIEKSVEGVKTTVTGVQNSQSGFEKRMTTVEQTANGLSNSVSQLAQTTTNQGKQITDANSKLDQQAKLIEAKVNIKQVEDYVGGFQIPALKNTVDKNREEALKQIADKVAKADYNKKTTEIDNRLKINEEGIGLSAKKTEVYTRLEADGKYATTAYVKTMEARIDVAERNINLSVKEGNVIAAINISKETIQLDAKRINLRGAVTAESIAGKLLEGVTIRAVDPNDKNKKAEMTSGGKIFSEWKTTPDPANWNTARFETGLQGGALYTKTFDAQGNEKYKGEVTALGVSFSIGNDNANYGASVLSINDNGQGKSVTAKAYLETEGWRPVFACNHPRENEYGVFKSNGLKFVKYGSYQNQWVNEGNKSFISLYRARLSSDDAWWGYLQIKSGDDSSHSGVVATEYKTTSQRKMKTFIKDLQFDALQDVLGLKIKEYYFKSDINTLYEMREQRVEGQMPYTLNDIPKYYGFMVDDCPISFTDTDRKGVNLYASLSVTIKGFQQYVAKTDERLNKIEKVINNENSSTSRNLRKSGGRTAKRSQSRKKHLFIAHNRTRSGKSTA
ncbi:TPA: phage tail protein [Bacillus cereus]|nr:phage tail protein [Bacillus cereus]